MNKILQAMKKISKAEKMLTEAEKLLDSEGIVTCRPRYFKEAPERCHILLRDGLDKLAAAAGATELVNPHYRFDGEVVDSDIGFVYEDVFFFTLIHEEDENDDDISD